MEAKIAEKWASDLESGKYAQIKQSLHMGPGYCALGVLYKTIGKDIPLDQDGLSPEIMKLSRIKHKHCKFPDYKTITNMNDHWGWDFKRIAAEIRIHYNEL
jgi:hypothetical protein